MILSKLIQEIRVEVDDPDAKKHTDKDLAVRVQEQLMHMFRKQSEINKGYHNYTTTLLASQARQISSDTYEYDLPRWISKVIDVRRAQGSSTNPRDNRVRFLQDDDQDFESGWLFSGMHAIQLSRFGQAIDLDLKVSKRPARLTLGTLPDQDGLNPNQLRLDAVKTPAENPDADKYPHETEVDAYANSIVEITGTSTASHLVESQVRVVKSSDPVVFVTGDANPYTVLTLNKDWDVAPVENDTYEMHAEVPDEHLRLLTLLVARSSFARKGSKDEIRAIMDELKEQWAAFISHYTPRQHQRTRLIRTNVAIGTDPGRDPDQAPFLWW